MRILLTNDDGLFAPGIAALAMALQAEHELLVIAPDTERSGVGHSFTIYTPLRLREHSLWGMTAYAFSGTPVDCVKFGIGNMGFEPELVVSGVNAGENLGTDVLYSGTVGAATEGVLCGLPAIAVSLCFGETMDYSPAAEAVKRYIPRMGKDLHFININVPNQPEGGVKGDKYTALSFQQYEMRYTKRMDPFNRAYYWVPLGKLTQHAPDDDTDERWIHEGYVTITPLSTDRTDYRRLRALTGEGSGQT